MNNNKENSSPLQEQFADVFSHLREQDIEQFYAQYQLWSLRRRIPLLEGQISTLREHLAENQQLIKSLQPSALAMAVLARLQSNGVSDVDVLDRMLERGESWLDKMMQRLDYCEQVEDFIQGDYTQWCINSLDGAYDWLDPVLNPAKEEETPAQISEIESETTEEMMLQRLALEDEETPQPAPASEYEPETAAQEIPVEAEAGVSTGETAPLPTETGGESKAREDVTEIEQTPEPATSAEAVDAEESLAPWYSVNLGENAATDAGDQDAMNDWIKVLQADTGESLAVSEVQAEQAGAPPPEAPASIADELPIPELENETEHLYFAEAAQVETAPAEQESLPAEPTAQTETEQAEEAAQLTGEVAPTEIEPVALAQATKFPAPSEEADAASLSEPVETQQPSQEAEQTQGDVVQNYPLFEVETRQPLQKTEQAEAVPIEEQNEATTQLSVGDNVEVVETALLEQEAAPVTPLPPEQEATLAQTEPAPPENQAALTEIETALLEQEAAPVTPLPPEQEATLAQTETAPPENQAALTEIESPSEETQEKEPPDLVVASEMGKEDSPLVERAGQAQQEENRENQHESSEELEGWQTWSTNQDDDKTEPMPLRAIQSSLELEPTVKLADLVNNEAEEAPQETASEPAMLNEPEQRAEAPASAPAEYFEPPASLLEEQTGGSAVHEQAQNAAPSAQLMTPLPPSEARPQAKRGFWHWLFGWLRNN
ncbi:MAG TPA: hypothetical protein VKV19_05520 [Ktedonobacteraceae bacterium]|nr:hypothetical protein [Ktedonobacteraceae bacterium]